MLLKTIVTAGAALAIATTALASSSLEDKHIIDTAEETGQFDILLAAVKSFGMADALRDQGPFTIFAPTDEAFSALPPETLEALLSNPEALASVLSNHVVYGKVMSDELQDNMTTDTANGSAVTLTDQDGMMINGANITLADIEASNGVIHAIDKVILPSS